MLRLAFDFIIAWRETRTRLGICKSVFGFVLGLPYSYPVSNVVPCTCREVFRTVP